MDIGNLRNIFTRKKKEAPAAAPVPEKPTDRSLDTTPVAAADPVNEKEAQQTDADDMLRGIGDYDETLPPKDGQQNNQATTNDDDSDDDEDTTKQEQDAKPLSTNGAQEKN